MYFQGTWTDGGGTLDICIVSWRWELGLWGNVNRRKWVGLYLIHDINHWHKFCSSRTWVDFVLLTSVYDLLILVVYDGYYYYDMKSACRWECNRILLLQVIRCFRIFVVSLANVVHFALFSNTTNNCMIKCVWFSKYDTQMHTLKRSTQRKLIVHLF